VPNAHGPYVVSSPSPFSLLRTQKRPAGVGVPGFPIAIAEDQIRRPRSNSVARSASRSTRSIVVTVTSGPRCRRRTHPVRPCGRPGSGILNHSRPAASVRLCNARYVSSGPSSVR